MKHWKVFALSGLLLLVSSLSVTYGCGLFRGRGFFGGRRCGAQQCASSCQPAPESVIAAGACACCDGCSCEAASCRCKIGGEPCSPACRCLLAAQSCQAKPAVDPLQFPGVIHEKMHKGGDKYSINGRAVTRHEVIQALTTVPDDRKELSLTFMGGTDAERSEAVATAQSLGLDRKMLLQSYPADNPIVRDKGFTLSGHPSVYLETPDGKPLLKAARADKQTLMAFASTAAAYDDAKTPTAGQSFLTDLQKELSAVPCWVWVALGIFLLILWQKKELKK